MILLDKCVDLIISSGRYSRNLEIILDTFNTHNSYKIGDPDVITKYNQKVKKDARNLASLCATQRSLYRR